METKIKSIDQVSILMAVYNQKATIIRAINSIINQTYSNWEMVIIDDHSTDGTYALLVEVAQSDQRIKVYRNEKNIGLAKSLNFGATKISNQLIARMDGDDISKSTRIEKQIAFMLENPSIDVVGTGAELIDDNGEFINLSLLPESHEDLKDIIVKKSVFFHPSVMIRKSFFDITGGYSENLIRGQDYELWIKGLYRGAKYHNLQEPLIEYRTSSKNKSINKVFYEFYARGYATIKFGYYRGIIYAFVDLIKNILVHYRLYRPLSLRSGATQ